MHPKAAITVFLLSFLFFSPVAAEDIPTPCHNQPLLMEDEPHEKVLKTALLGIGAITLWGVLEWDYFATSPHSTSEGWFGRDTDDGGADKLGHAYSAYLISHGLAHIYESWGFARENAALYGSLVSLGMMGYMELGDSFSSYGFSPEDMIANGAGALLGYLLYSNESLAGKIDFRWEYGFSPNKVDIFTDYENAKYLLAFKLSGFDATKSTVLRNFELHVGYYTRHFDNNDGERERNLYVGVGLNLTDLLSRHSWKKTATVLRYYQPPYTYLSASNTLD